MEFETTIARRRHTLTVSDGTEIFFKDWGTGQPIVFSHGWPLNADAWEDQMVFLGQHGYRCVAHDRRGHGRSSQPWTGNDMDTYADDATLKVYPGFSHGMCTVNKDQINADLLAFIKRA
jgi:alpha-beta hydrolase superfamily lysophospholipase